MTAAASLAYLTTTNTKYLKKLCELEKETEICLRFVRDWEMMEVYYESALNEKLNEIERQMSIKGDESEDEEV